VDQRNIMPPCEPDQTFGVYIAEKASRKLPPGVKRDNACCNAGLPQLVDELTVLVTNYYRLKAVVEISNDIIKLPVTASNAAASRKMKNSFHSGFFVQIPYKISCRQL
jgi:hypothetical protein